MPTPDARNQFLTVLDELDEGNLKTDLHNALKELVDAIGSTGKKGKLALTISISPSKGGVLVLEGAIKVSQPVAAPQSTIMYPNEDNLLSRNDPRQPRLPHTGPAEVRGFKERAAGAEE